MLLTLSQGALYVRVNLENKDSAKCVPQCLVRGLASTRRPIKHFLNKQAEDLDWEEGYRRKKRHNQEVTVGTEEPSIGGANCAGDLGGGEREGPGTIWDSIISLVFSKTLLLSLFLFTGKMWLYRFSFAFSWEHLGECYT